MNPHEKVCADVHAVGWHVLEVFSEDDSAPLFAYTIGLEQTFGHPELVIFGLNDDLDVMHRVLNALGERVRKGERFEHGARKRGVLSGYVCAFARFPKSAFEEHLGQASAFYGGKPFRAVQCIWPDPKKRFPWDRRVMLPALNLRRQPVFLRPDAPGREPPWPFAEPHSRFVLTTRQVATGKEPVRFVGRFRDYDGTLACNWQFVCETTEDPADLVITTLGWMLDHDPSLRRIAGLERGDCARRAHPKSGFRRGTMPHD